MKAARGQSLDLLRSLSVLWAPRDFLFFARRNTNCKCPLTRLKLPRRHRFKSTAVNARQSRSLSAAFLIRALHRIRPATATRSRAQCWGFAQSGALGRRGFADLLGWTEVCFWPPAAHMAWVFSTAKGSQETLYRPGGSQNGPAELFPVYSYRLTGQAQ